MFNRENINVRPLSEEFEGMGLDPDRVMSDIERNSGLLESHAGSPPSSSAVRKPLNEENLTGDADEEVEWDGEELDEDDDDAELYGEGMTRHKKGYRVDSSGKMVKVSASQKRKEKSGRRKQKGKLKAASRAYRRRFKSKIQKRRKRISKSGKQKKGFVVRQEGVAAQLSQLREELESSNVNTGEPSPHEEAAINAGWLALLLGECFEAMGDTDAGEMLYAMSDSAADLSESIESNNGELGEDLEIKLTTLLEGVSKALSTHEEIGSPSLFESIEMGADNGLYEDEEDDEEEDCLDEEDSDCDDFDDDCDDDCDQIDFDEDDE